MGRCSATDVFDPVVKTILYGADLGDHQKLIILKSLIDALEEYDWDCQSDSEYFDHELVRQAFMEIHSEWGEE